MCIRDRDYHYIGVNKIVRWKIIGEIKQKIGLKRGDQPADQAGTEGIRGGQTGIDKIGGEQIISIATHHREKLIPVIIGIIGMNLVRIPDIRGIGVNLGDIFVRINDGHENIAAIEIRLQQVDVGRTGNLIIHQNPPICLLYTSFVG